MKHGLITFALILSSIAAHAGSFLVGMEDMPTGGDNDYNDVIALVQGQAILNSPGVFSSLTAAQVNQSATPFWNNLSSDGANMNIGDYALGSGGFSGGPVLPGIQYLSTPSGGVVSFYFTGAATISIIGGITGGKDTLGVCPISDCSAANTTWITGTLNYAPDVPWQLVGTNLFGQQWFSNFGPGQTSEFAAFQGTSAVPEPGTNRLMGAAILAFGLILFRRKRERPRRFTLS